MRFSKKGDVYTIIRATGSQDNILGITFDSNLNPRSKGKDSNSIEVLEWVFPNINEKSVKTSKQEVMEQVIKGLDAINSSLSTNYCLAKIYFCPFDNSTNQVYSGLIAKLIRHYHEGKKFDEV